MCKKRYFSITNSEKYVDQDNMHFVQVKDKKKSKLYTKLEKKICICRECFEKLKKAIVPKVGSIYVYGDATYKRGVQNNRRSLHLPDCFRASVSLHLLT